MLGKSSGNEWMELNISAILNPNCTPTSMSTQGSITINAFPFLLSHHTELVVHTWKNFNRHMTSTNQ